MPPFLSSEEGGRRAERRGRDDGEPPVDAQSGISGILRVVGRERLSALPSCSASLSRYPSWFLRVPWLFQLLALAFEGCSLVTRGLHPL